MAFDPITHFATRCMPFGSPWASLELDLIGYRLRLITILVNQTGFASCAISVRLRRRITSSSVAQFIVRSWDGSTVFSKSYRRLATSLVTLTKMLGLRHVGGPSPPLFYPPTICTPWTCLHSADYFLFHAAPK
jgi:hypothetical protein